MLWPHQGQLWSRETVPFCYLAEELLPVVISLGSDGEDACDAAAAAAGAAGAAAASAAADPVLRGCQAALKHLPIHNNTLIKKQRKFSSYI